MKTFIENFCQFFFRRQKMKCRESSETRFGQVSRRSEPSSRGKRPFKVCRVRCRAGFSSPTRVGDRFDLCRGIPYALQQAWLMDPSSIWIRLKVMILCWSALGCAVLWFQIEVVDLAQWRQIGDFDLKLKNCADLRQPASDGPFFNNPM